MPRVPQFVMGNGRLGIWLLLRGYGVETYVSYQYGVGAKYSDGVVAAIFMITSRGNRANAKSSTAFVCDRICAAHVRACVCHWRLRGALSLESSRTRPMACAS